VLSALLFSRYTVGRSQLGILNLLKSLVLALNAVESFTEITGRLIAWLTMVMVTLVVLVVVTRYFLEIGSIALQESVTYLHCLVFLMGLGFTLKHDGHVRVDIFYRGFSPKSKAMVNLAGGLLFLVPFCLLVFVTSWDYVLASWKIRETSAENNGLPFIYLLKTLMLLMPVSLLLQGIAEIIKNGLVIIGVDISGTQIVENNEPLI
jgi:TRAP-type mannitol/chloroaromatic compound transport system permease small subunit